MAFTDRCELSVAFYSCQPPSSARVVRAPKVRPILREFIRDLLLVRLNDSTCERVLQMLRKLPWKQEDVSYYVRRKLFRADKVRWV